MIAKTIEYNPDTYQHVDLESVIYVFKHYIMEYNLMERYKEQHEDRFIAQAVQDSAYISHPVTFTPQDFQDIFDNVIS